MNEIIERLEAIELALQALVESKEKRTYYSTAEVAKQLGKAEFTVREWARLHRIYAEKRDSGRGRAKEWMIAHEEVVRIKNEGLLPL